MKKYPNRHVYKISTTRLQKAKWNLKIDFKTAMKNKEIVDLADSTALRFIREIIGEQNDVEYIADLKAIKQQLKELNEQKHSKENAKKYRELSSKYHDKLMVNDYVLVEMKKKSRKHKDFDRANKGFKINGKQFEYFLATTGGVKNEVVVYVSSDVYTELNRRTDNGRNMDIEFTPAKLSAYRSLVCSASTPVPDPRGVLLVKDYIRKVNEDVIYIKNHPDPDNYRPVIEETNQPIDININDGFGFITYRLAKEWSKHLGLSYVPSSYIVRNAFCKGVLVVFDFYKFSRKEANKKTIVAEAWPDSNVDISKKAIDIVLTTSMLKAWNAYESMDDYLSNCKKNGYMFSITKYAPKQLENQRNLNYQFIQSLSLSPTDIQQLINPTIDMLQASMCGDWAKTLLYLKGDHLTDNTKMTGDYDFTEALAIDKRMMNDPFVKQRLKSMLSKRIDEAKKGDLIIEGHFATLVGDPYALAQHMFGLEPTGLLKANEFYSAYWNEQSVDTVVGFRAPMTVYNNIRKLKLVNTEKMRTWYEHLKQVFIVNTYDLTLSAMNGADMDGDQILTTNSKPLIKAVNNEKVIICEQTPAKKIKPTREDFIQADKNGFGNRIGGITNRGTALYDVLSRFEKGSHEYEEVMCRLMSIQKGQQDEIDKMKGIQTKPLPKGWFDSKEWIVNEDDTDEEVKEKQFNSKLVSDLKPYFFIYNYPYVMNTYKDHKRKANSNCIYRFNVNIDELIRKETKTLEEEKFLVQYYKDMPVSVDNSTMNRVCRAVEQSIKYKSYNSDHFDYSILKTDKPYGVDTYDKILSLYDEHNKDMQIFNQVAKADNLDDDEVREERSLMVENFKHKVFSINNDIEDVANIVLDICYGKYENRSKQFAWDIAGKQIIKNLLAKNNYMISYPVQSNDGDIEYRGNKFTIITKEVEAE